MFFYRFLLAVSILSQFLIFFTSVRGVFMKYMTCFYKKICHFINYFARDKF